MAKTEPQKKSRLRLDKYELPQPKHRQGPGRGIGQKRLEQQRLEQLDTLFQNLQQVQYFLNEHGHIIINESGSLLTSQAHQNLDQLVQLLEDFLWVLNCAIAKHGGTPKLI